MVDKSPLTTGKKPVSPQNQGREDRLKAALKANLARRKAQTRARRVSLGDIECDNANQIEDREEQNKPGKTED